MPGRVPPGKQTVIARLKRPSYLGGPAEFHFPVTIDNPDFGKPLEDPAYLALKKAHAGKAVKFASFRRAANPSKPAKGFAEEKVIAGAVTDNTMTEGIPKGSYPGWANYGRGPSMTVGLRAGDGKTHKNRGLLKFDLSLLPKEAKVVGAQLRLTLVRTDMYSELKPGAKLEVFGVRRPWAEVKGSMPGKKAHYSCWNGPAFVPKNPKPDNIEWGVYGCDDPKTDRFPEPETSLVVGPFPDKLDPNDKSKKPDREFRRLIALDIGAIVRKWHVGEVPNHGLLLKIANAGSVRICSSEFQDYPFRPTLVVAYEGPEPKVVKK